MKKIGRLQSEKVKPRTKTLPPSTLKTLRQVTPQLLSNLGKEQRMIDQHIFNEKDASERLGVARKTLQNWRYLRKYLPYVKRGRRVLYELSAIERYEAESRVGSIRHD